MMRRRYSISLAVATLANVGLLAWAAGNAAAPAQKSVSNTPTISWKPVTQYTDGKAITDPVLYQIRRANTCDDPTPTLLVETTQLSVKLSPQPVMVKCFLLTAVVNGVSSAPSASGEVQIRPPAPTDGRIEKPTDGRVD